MEKKLRIQLFDSEGRLMDDRSVSQDPEFAKGPKSGHTGLFRIEFTLEDVEDVDKAKKYLDQLTGTLPTITKKLKKSKIELPEPQQRENLLELVTTNPVDQDELINTLRGYGFKFMMSDFLLSFNYEGLVIKERHIEEYQWMLLQTKTAKVPKSEKYDPMLIFGIKLLGDRDEKVVVYLNGEFHKSFKIPIPEKPKEVFKKLGMMQFPHYMTPEEREKFRHEVSMFKNDPEKKLTKFFVRWKPYVKNIPTLSQEETDENAE